MLFYFYKITLLGIRLRHAQDNLFRDKKKKKQVFNEAA